MFWQLDELVHWLCTHLPLLISKARFSNFYESAKKIPTFPIMQPNNIIGMSTSLKNKEYVLGEGRGDPERHHPSVFSYKISGVALTVFNFIALLQSYFSAHVGMCLAETESLAGFQSLVWNEPTFPIMQLNITSQRSSSNCFISVATLCVQNNVHVTSSSQAVRPSWPVWWNKSRVVPCLWCGNCCDLLNLLNWLHLSSVKTGVC